MTIEAVIFDMDGVLFDTEQFYYDRRKNYLDTKGIDISHLPPSFFIGGNMKQVWQAILHDDYENWDVDQLQKEYTEYKDNHPLPYRDLIFDDVKATLKKLNENGIKIGIASSSTKSDILLALRENEIIDYFTVILSGHEFKESKPDPAIYNEAVRQLDLPKDKIVILEDSTKGIAAGVSAGVEVWAIKDYRFDLDQSAAHQFVDNLTEFVEKIAL